MSHRMLDLTLAAAAIVVAAPLALLTAASVALAFGRPLFFVQRRAGRAGGVIAVPKFRTMHPPLPGRSPLEDTEARTPFIGRLLRRLRLDELPQIWSILAGDMSLVGPRPLLPETVASMGHHGQERCSIRPGLTGWAQVHGNSLLSNDDKLALDLWYVRNRSLGLDMMILLRTAGVLLLGEQPHPQALERARAGVGRRSG